MFAGLTLPRVLLLPFLVFLDISKLDLKPFTFDKRKWSVFAKWIVKGIGERNLGRVMQSAREAYKPDVRHDRKAKFSASDLFSNPFKLNESLYTALKSIGNLSASVAKINTLKKIYRKQTDALLDMAKPFFSLLEKGRRDKTYSNALITLSFLWANPFHDITPSWSAQSAQQPT